MPSQMRHLVIFLPGIMGSVLQKDGKDIWALSGQAVWQYLCTMGKSLRDLRIDREDWQQDDLGDGITATSLIEDIHSIAGIGEHAGYSVFIRRMRENFDITEGSLHAPREDANFFSFPYDWRRDNRVSALKLKSFIANQLPSWRASSGATDAQVILIAHSMGGLVSRYYLEALDGWRDCRALMTIGTPHRGSLNALDTLSNGFHKGHRKFFHELCDVVRSFTSVYQLVPSYPVLELNGTYIRVADTNKLPNVNPMRAKAARDEFHEVIRQSALQNRNASGYKQRTLPWVGTRQDTLQSALLEKGELVVRYSRPVGLDESLADGDGTVPRVSAVPPDLDGQGFERFTVERHGWLTNNDMTLDPILETLKQIVASGSRNLYGELETTRPSLKLRLDPLYLPDEPVTIQVKQMDGLKGPQAIYIKVISVGQPVPCITRDLQINSDDSSVVELGELAPGLYHLTVGPQVPAPRAPAAVHGAFEVVDRASLE